MIQLSELIGHDTLDVSTAASGGKVTGIGVAADRIVTVGIGDMCIDAMAIRGFDGDVVTYQPAVQPAAESPVGAQTEHSAAPGDPRGTMVLDLHGDQLGTLADLAISDEGVVDTILLAGGHSLRGSRLRVIGTYAAIVDVEPATQAR